MNILQLSYSLLISGQLMTMFVGLGYLNKKLRNKKYALLSILVILLISVLYHEETLQSALFYASLSIILLIFSGYVFFINYFIFMFRILFKESYIEKSTP
ncbi:hypothetical protein A5836_002066 [Enterococcus faecium]|nr:hypothetical protein A5836_002066 [Enterococcus faecium]